jgi:hypothetical protein
MHGKPFENVKNQIGYCGLWCGSCIVGNGTLKELTKKYAHLIRGYGVDKWGAKDFDGNEFVKGLASIQALPICPGCLKGGGNDECRIRPCAAERKVSDCTVCNEFMKCKNSEAIRKMRTGASAVGMLMRNASDKPDQQRLIRKWIAEIRNKFPSCVIEV